MSNVCLVLRRHRRYGFGLLLQIHVPAESEKQFCDDVSQLEVNKISWFGFIVSMQVGSAHNMKERIMWKARKRTLNSHTQGNEKVIFL